MPPKRILVLGITGVDKERAIDNLLDFYAEDPHGKPQPVAIDFEKQYIPRIADLHEYLDEKERNQSRIWEEAWSDFSKDYGGYEGDIILSLHGVIVRKLYGFRSPLNLKLLEEWAPTDIVTLIDDIYMCWFRTEYRAGGLDWKGRPTLEQLLTARRVETHTGDLIAGHCTARKYTKNYILAVRHPVRVLYRLLYGPQPQTKPVYLSFPITGPRDMREKGSNQGIDEVNGFIKEASGFEVRNPNVACFCPLAIDELPIESLFKMMDGGSGREAAKDSSGAVAKMDIETVLKQRWEVDDFWDGEILLTDDSVVPEIAKTAIELDIDQVRDALGLIRTDVAHRDFRLVLQSKCLVVFNPWFDNQQSYGVDNEIACAYQHQIPTFIYQDPEHGDLTFVEQELKRQVGALGGRPGQEYIKFYGSLEDLFGDVERRILSKRLKKS